MANGYINGFRGSGRPLPTPYKTSQSRKYAARNSPRSPCYHANTFEKRVRFNSTLTNPDLFHSPISLAHLIQSKREDTVAATGILVHQGRRRHPVSNPLSQYAYRLFHRRNPHLGRSTRFYPPCWVLRYLPAQPCHKNTHPDGDKITT